MGSRRFPTTMMTGTALLLALGVALPLVFHAFPLGGRIFLPMHIPAFIAGLVLGPVPGLIVGAGAPVLSAMITGRPPIFYMVPMVFELATYGVVAGLLRPRIEAAVAIRRRRAGPDAETSRSTSGVLLTLLAAMVAGRAVWLLTVVWLAPFIGIEARTVAVALGALGAGWLGAAIQLALVPAIVRAIERLRIP
ncbi:MAG: ECF transporter S component [Candidatus Eisenbacteria bacterium]|nr:ECF transporter S component [Candidatus Eisenbacteria bacterium]